MRSISTVIAGSVVSIRIEPRVEGSSMEYRHFLSTWDPKEIFIPFPRNQFNPSPRVRRLAEFLEIRGGPDYSQWIATPTFAGQVCGTGTPGTDSKRRPYREGMYEKWYESLSPLTALIRRNIRLPAEIRTFRGTPFETRQVTRIAHLMFHGFSSRG